MLLLPAIVASARDGHNPTSLLPFPGASSSGMRCDARSPPLESEMHPLYRRSGRAGWSGYLLVCYMATWLHCVWHGAPQQHLQCPPHSSCLAVASFSEGDQQPLQCACCTRLGSRRMHTHGQDSSARCQLLPSTSQVLLQLAGHRPSAHRWWPPRVVCPQSRTPGRRSAPAAAWAPAAAAAQMPLRLEA
jgi:hypothetical protein